jgi:hypothetical protein
MPVTFSEGGTCFSGEKGVELFRLTVLASGLRFEMKCPGMRLHRGPKCTTIARKMGLKGSPEKLLAQVEQKIAALREVVVVVDERAGVNSDTERGPHEVTPG